MLFGLGRKFLNMFTTSDEDCLHPVSIAADGTDAVRGPTGPDGHLKPEETRTSRYSTYSQLKHVIELNSRPARVQALPTVPWLFPHGHVSSS